MPQARAGGRQAWWLIESVKSRRAKHSSFQLQNHRLHPLHRLLCCMLVTTVTVLVLRSCVYCSQRAWKRMMAAYPHPCLFSTSSFKAVRRSQTRTQACRSQACASRPRRPSHAVAGGGKACVCVWDVRVRQANSQDSLHRHRIIIASSRGVVLPNALAHGLVCVLQPTHTLTDTATTTLRRSYQLLACAVIPSA